MNDFELDHNNRPIYPAKIINSEVIWNPFDDITPRESILRKRKLPESAAKPKPKAAKK